MIAIVTDSTSDIPPSLAAERKITVVPQHILWGTDDLRDGVDIVSDTFYKRLANSSESPRTSQPVKADFAGAFRDALQQHNADEIVCITISKLLSGTHESALQAQAEADFNVTVIDSEFVSMGLGLQVLRAAELREEGATAAEIEAELAHRRPHVRIFFTVDTLDYLHRGGRIGRASHLVGTALKIKPILHVTEGQVASKESVRTRSKALKRMIDIIQEDLGDRQPAAMSVMHGNAAEDAKTLDEEVAKFWQPEQLYRSTVGVTVGTHAGPGVVGIAYDGTPA